MIPLKDNVFRREFPVMTWIIILVNAAVFLFEISLPPDALNQVIQVFGLVPARYVELGLSPGSRFSVLRYLPLVTCMFLHGGWLHIIGNMWFLYLFGGSVEDRIGHSRYLFFYLLCGIIAGLSYIVFDAQSSVPSIGASGAIAGVMGAYILMFPSARILTLFILVFIPFFFELPAFFYLGLWFFLQIASETFSYLSPELGFGVAWWAHIGGFAAGMILLFLFRKRKHEYRSHQPDELHHYARS
jgi:membrane associated rhomboid family serine protease